MKIKQIVFLDEVADDLNDGINFYNNQSEWLGDYYFDSIISDIKSLHLYAGVHTKHFGYFRMLAKRFPFVIYYNVIENIAVVVAVLDARRKPSLILKKLINRK